MSKLVRAQVKAREYLPAWACPCMKGYTGHELTVDLSRIRAFPASTCLTCGTHLPEDISIAAVDGYWPLELLDLDEGEYVDSLEVADKTA